MSIQESIDQRWEAYARSSRVLSDVEAALLRLLDVERAKVQRIADLHYEMDGKCTYCIDGYETREDFPCYTIRLLADPEATPGY